MGKSQLWDNILNSGTVLHSANLRTYSIQQWHDKAFFSFNLFNRPRESTCGSDSIQWPKAQTKQDVSLDLALFFEMNWVGCLHDETQWTHSIDFEVISWFQGLTSLFSLIQKAVCHNISGTVPAAVWPGCLLLIPPLYWCLLCGSEVCLRLLRPGQTNCLSQHHSKIVWPCYPYLKWACYDTL